MSFTHYTDDEAAAVRAENPDCWLIERITAHAACLITIPHTHNGTDNAARITRRFPLPAAHLIDGATFNWETTP